MMDLRHYAATTVELDRDRVYVQRKRYKPRGFWVSILGEDDWPSWCQSEGIFIEDLMVEHEVRLGESANVLLLGSHSELIEFTREFGGMPAYPGDSDRDAIDWHRVSSSYDGIIITPYVMSQRLALGWYYGWDCASGCIWNLDAITSLSVSETKVNSL